ncbi:hypothetical protein GTY96_14330 [Corallococcus sp. c25j21]|nr:hypothetical protein [Corallococcus silvisoli]
MVRPVGVPMLSTLVLFSFFAGCSESECTEDRDCASRGPDIVCVDSLCVQSSMPDAGRADSGVRDAGEQGDAGEDDAGTGDAGVDDAGVSDAGVNDAGVSDAGVNDAGVRDAGTDGGAPSREASLRITEINPSGQRDLIELVAITGGALTNISLRELTNSGFSFTFPQGYSVADGAVLVLHLGGSCTDAPGAPASCGQTAPFSAQAWDFSMPGALSYSGKVFELLAADGSPVDGVPFVKASGAMPDEAVAAVQRLQADRVWDPTPCVHNPQTGFAKDLYCRNIAADWSGLGADLSVMRIGGATPLAVPGTAKQWSGPLPSRWGTY